MHNARNRRAAKSGSSRNGKVPPVPAKASTTPSFLLRRPDDPHAAGLITFPSDIVIPPHRGALPAAVLAITAPVAVPPAEPALSGGKKRKARKRIKSARPHKRKVAAKKQPGSEPNRPEPNRSERKKPAIAPRIHLPDPVAEAPPVILLPDRSEPLVQTAPEDAPTGNLAPMAPPPLIPPPVFRPNAAPPPPLPRRRAPVPWRAGGLFGLLAGWLQDGIRPIAALFAPKPKPKASRKGNRRFRTLPTNRPTNRVPTPQEEISRLRAENERLRLQLEAVLALRERELAADRVQAGGAAALAAH